MVVLLSSPDLHNIRGARTLVLALHERLELPSWWKVAGWCWTDFMDNASSRFSTSAEAPWQCFQMEWCKLSVRSIIVTGYNGSQNVSLRDILKMFFFVQSCDAGMFKVRHSRQSNVSAVQTICQTDRRWFTLEALLFLLFLFFFFLNAGQIPVFCCCCVWFLRVAAD